MARRQPSAALLPAALAACLTVFAAPGAMAQDPAAVGGHSDPALVGGGGWSAPPPPMDTLSPAQFSREGENNPQRSAQEVETLLGMVRGQLDGSRGDGTAAGNRADAIRYRGDAENLIRRNWDKLGPVTRDLYTAQYGRTNPNDASQRYVSPYGDGGQIENQLLGGAREASESMQTLEDLLLPMLQDLKRGFDTELRNRANGR